MRRVEAIRDYPERPKKGASQPLYMLCDDGQDYVVKFPKPDWPRALANEGVGAELLARLSLPAPAAAIVVVGQKLIEVSDVLRRRGIGPGEYFGTQRIANALDLSDAISKQLHPSMIENRPQAGGVIAFDNWVRNTDRNDGNVLLAGVRDTPGPRFHLYAIDHGLILTGHAWTVESLGTAWSDRTVAPCHPFLASCVWEPAEFDSCCRAIEAAAVDGIKECVKSLPESWALSDGERVAVVSFLASRRGLVREVLNGFPLMADKVGAA